MGVLLVPQRRVLLKKLLVTRFSGRTANMMKILPYVLGDEGWV